MADSGVCAISPSDLIGYVGNLITRVQELEQQVAELQAGNITANQLSDLSQQVGWVGGVNYMGSDGWTQTEYGSLVPPAGVSFSSLGFTLSDGNTYPFVVMDADGVLQYGFTNTGELAGTAGSAIAKDTLVLSAASQTLNAFNQAISWSAIQFQSGTSITWTSGSTITLTVPGTYAITFRIEQGTTWNTPPTATNSLIMRFTTQLDDAGTGSPLFLFPTDAASTPDPYQDFKTMVVHKKVTHTTSLTVNFRNGDGSIDILSSIAITRLGSQ